MATFVKFLFYFVFFFFYYSLVHTLVETIIAGLIDWACFEWRGIYYYFIWLIEPALSTNSCTSMYITIIVLLPHHTLNM